MIVIGMTYDEIITEVNKDVADVFELSCKKDAKIKRIIQKSHLFPVRLYSFVTSSNKNRWLLTWEAYSRKHVGDNILFSMICIINNKNGRIAIMPSFQNLQRPLFFIFLPHFFQRFAERMQIDATGEELIRRFFQFNVNFSIDTKRQMVSDTQYTIESTATSPDGISLGYQLADGNFFFKTFITYDMAKGEQIEAFRTSELRRVESHEGFLKSIL